MSLSIKMYFACITLLIFLAILYPESLANLMVEVGTRHTHQILLSTSKIAGILHSLIELIMRVCCECVIYFTTYYKTRHHTPQSVTLTLGVYIYSTGPQSSR